MADFTPHRHAELAPESKPFGGYTNFAACATANKDKDNPNAYCATIMRAVEGKDIDWLDERSWYNDRIFETFINDARADFDNEKLRLEAQVAAMPYFMERGFLEWMHGVDTADTPVPIGKPLAWRVKDGKVEVRFGVDDANKTGSPWVDERWAIIKRFGSRGTVSLTFAPLGQKRFVKEGFATVLEIPKAWIWSAGWVGPYAASPGAKVNYVSAARAMPMSLMPVMKAYIIPPGGALPGIKLSARDPSAVCGEMWFHGSEAQRGGFSGGAAGRGRSEKPPKEWFDDCVSHVSKSLELGDVTFNTLGAHPLASRMGTDSDLDQFIKSHGVVRLKAEAMVDSCAPCGEFVKDLESKGVPHEAAMAALQKKLDDLVNENAKAKTMATDSKPNDMPGAPSGGGCPEGMHKDAKSGECVPNPPGAMEEAIKTLQSEINDLKGNAFKAMSDQVSDLRLLVMRALKEAVAPEPTGKATPPAPPAPPADDWLDKRLKQFGEEYLRTMKADLNSAINDRLDQLNTELVEVRTKMRAPAGGRRGQTDNRSVGPATKESVLQKFYAAAGKGGVK